MTTTATAASAVQKGDIVQAPKNNRMYRVTFAHRLPLSGKIRLWGFGVWQAQSRLTGPTRIGTFLPDQELEVQD